MLVVTHEASLTGAPMNLWHLLGWIRANTDIEVQTVTLGDGPLVAKFEQHGGVTRLDRHLPFRVLGLADRALTRFGPGIASTPV